MKPQKQLSSLLLVSVLISFSSQAQENDTYELDPIQVVTPSRMTESLGESLASVSVITRENIELSIAEDLLELLRLILVGHHILLKSCVLLDVSDWIGVQ